MRIDLIMCFLLLLFYSSATLNHVLNQIQFLFVYIMINSNVVFSLTVRYMPISLSLIVMNSSLYDVMFFKSVWHPTMSDGC